MAVDPLFNKVSLQLIETPRSSASLLAAAARGEGVDNPPETEQALLSAGDWVRLPFREIYKAPEDTPLVAIPEESGLCDVVRARHTVKGCETEIAQTCHLLSINIRGFAGPPGATEEQRAEYAARTILEIDEPLELVKLGVAGGRTYGMRAEPPEETEDEGEDRWPDWADTLRWWCTASDVGFVMLKAMNEPTRELISPDEEMNRFWFEQKVAE